MSHVMRTNLAGGVAALATLFSSLDVSAEVRDVAAAMPATIVVQQGTAQPGPVAVRANPMGMEPLDPKMLASRRGAADVYNDMQLKGVVSDNRAVNVTTGSNVITEGAFSSAAGVPMVVQNSGNNVLIQNATILNIQLK